MTARCGSPNAATVLGLCRRLSNAFKRRGPKAAKRCATARDWIEENHFNRWLGIRPLHRPRQRQKRKPKPPHEPLTHLDRELMQPASA